MNREVRVAGQEDPPSRPEGAAPEGLGRGRGLTAAQGRELRQVVEELMHILAAPEHFGAAERERVLQRARAVLQATAPHLETEDGR
ncbi:hypothetical protein [Deinococcus aestuarii]|uniref:hypothetical protein n=1 Tax=Deinococcus aestuarii TaxID=2774531 RepID=UPI001C0B051D|nr:hypothetical protein [Deinococcus aestuarii]